MFREIMGQIYRIILAIISLTLTAVLSYKIIVSDVIFDISRFSFSDLLSLILALFSISLALIFYHKATETSNTFYDNTYKFTNHVSEVLGRIEAGFSERLRHLDEGYTKLGDRFDRMSPPQKREAEAALKAEEKVVEEKEQERNMLLEELARQSRLNDTEKAEMLARLHAQEVELATAREEAHMLRRRLDDDQLPAGLRSAMTRYARRHVVPQMGGEDLLSSSTQNIRARFREVHSSLPEEFLRDMAEMGYISNSRDITPSGAAFLRRLSRQEEIAPN